MTYSDGEERGENYQPSTLAQAISSYFAEAREEKLLELKWENEELRRILRESNGPGHVARAAA